MGVYDPNHVDTLFVGEDQSPTLIPLSSPDCPSRASAPSAFSLRAARSRLRSSTSSQAATRTAGSRSSSPSATPATSTSWTSSPTTPTSPPSSRPGPISRASATRPLSCAKLGSSPRKSRFCSSRPTAALRAPRPPRRTPRPSPPTTPSATSCCRTWGVPGEAGNAQAGVIRCDVWRDLFNIGRLIRSQPLPRGRRVGGRRREARRGEA